MMIKGGSAFGNGFLVGAGRSEPDPGLLSRLLSALCRQNQHKFDEN